MSTSLVHKLSCQHGRSLNTLLVILAAFAIGVAVYAYRDILNNEVSIDFTTLYLITDYGFFNPDLYIRKLKRSIGI